MKKWTEKTIELKEKFSRKAIITSIIGLLLSLVLYNATNNVVWDAISGLGIIVFGARLAIFIIVYFILFLVERMSKNKKPIKKKVSKKITKKKPAIVKKVTKKTAKKVAKKKK
ncbi:MAG: hypothetical protein PF542_06660 [Nanoarchaeota archaeon]|jgi:phosphate/sulfate permease|nr:hypothetical protein [Nanoarchaeota archaeon]